MDKRRNRFPSAPLALLLGLGCALLLAGRAGARSAETVMLKLRDGRVLFGSVEGHDPEALGFRRLDTGGRVELPWELLDPEQDRELRLAFGYIEPRGREILATADRIPIVDGTELVGKIVARGEDHLVIKHAGGSLRLPLARVAGAARSVEVPALEIYTREELYELRVDEVGPGLARGGEEAAELHLELAEFCERILEFDRALDHLAAAAEAAPDLRADERARDRARLEEKAKSQEQWEALEEADRLRARGQYTRALALLDQFAERYPDSPANEDRARLVARTLEAQDRSLREEVVRRWHRWVERHAQDLADETSYDRAVEVAEAELGERVLASVHAELVEDAPELTPEVVRAMWDERPKRGRLHRASYGLGTWLLGEERARARPDLEEEEGSEAPPETEAQRARRELEERMRRYVAAQRASQSRRGASEQDDPEAFWRDFSRNARRQWITAYYAEFSGDMQVERVRLSNCPDCGGTGAREVLYLGSARAREDGGRTGTGGSRLEVCPTCHYAGVVRRLQYR